MATATLETAADETEVLGSKAASDELLSKMAGAEIDRLLAETEADRAKAAPSAAASTPTTDSSPQPPSAVAAEDSALAAQLDDLIQGLEPDGTKPPVAPAIGDVVGAAEAKPAPPAASVAEPAMPPAEPTSAPAAEADRIEKLAAELEVDKPPAAAPAPAPPAEPSVEPLAAEAPAAKQEPGIPLLLRPLIWINAPLAGCSDGARALIGKAAIVTIVNATAILLYTVLVKRHH